MAKYLVQDTELTSVADAIRAKGGTSEQLAFPDGFVSAVEGIQAGGGVPSWFGEVIELGSLFSPNSGKYTPNLSEFDINIRELFPKCTSIEGMFSSCHDVKKITLHADNIVYAKNAIFAHQTFNDRDLKVVDLSDFETKNITQWESFLSGRKGLETILGVLDFSSATNFGQALRWCEALKDVTFAPNKIKFTLNQYDVFNCASLSDASIVSLANALIYCGDGTLSLTLHATPKARCDEILGTVSAVTDGDVTYDFFTQDASGTVALTEFITTTKGWTLA